MLYVMVWFCCFSSRGLLARGPLRRGVHERPDRERAGVAAELLQELLRVLV